MPDPAVTIRPFTLRDAPEADEVFRLAFGTFLGLKDPTRFAPGADYMKTRYRADPKAAFAAEKEGRVVGSNFATNWGSVGFFGPLTVRPDLWDQDIGKMLMEPVLQCFTEWGTRHVGLFTFAQSPKHVGLYQKFGFWPRFLGAILSKPVVNKGTALPPRSLYSAVPAGERKECLMACRLVTDGVHDGLAVDREIRCVDEQRIGDTILLWRGLDLDGFAVCHLGKGSEAENDSAYVKFATVRHAEDPEKDFDKLLDLCEDWAAARGASRLVAGASMGREAAFRRMAARGFRSEMQGVRMHRPNEPGYDRKDVFLIDDWR